MELDDGRAVPNFIAAAMADKPIVIYGDGSATRCFQFATDCVRGLEALMNGDYDGPVNIGSDHETTVGEIAEMISKAVAAKVKQDTPVSIQFLPKRQDDPVQRKPDISLAQEVLGWRPKIPLEQGIASTVDWFVEKRMTEVNGLSAGKDK